MNRKVWQKLKCPKKSLQLSVTLTGGQSFRWKKANLDDCEEECFIGVIGNCLWQLRQSENHLFYRVVGPKPKAAVDESQNHESILKAYFRLDIDLDECYAQWSQSHPHFKSEAGNFYGIRLLNQDPVENLFSFICSQNNHISRISSLVEKLCKNYGPKICEINGTAYHAFPSFDKFTDPKVEQELRNESFGYRAKFIHRSAVEIKEKGGLDWFQKLQSMTYKDAHTELTTLTGIGPKVADCICLMSLNHLEAIPVDTHVLKIALQHYLPKGREAKSMTPKLYNEIGDAFRSVYKNAGWAQTVLFCADLAKFKENESNNVQDGCSTKKKRKKA